MLNSIVVFVFGGFFCFLFLSLFFSKEIVVFNQGAQLAFLSQAFQEQEKKEPAQVIVFAVGDIMLSRGVALKIKTEGKGDFRFPFLKIADYLKNAALLFGNLEGTISERGVRVGSIYSFRMDPAVIEGLKYAGFDVLSLANNHMLDYQNVALEDTMTALSGAGIDYVGAGFNERGAFSMKKKTTSAGKIGFLAFTNIGPAGWRAGKQSPGIAWLRGEQDIENVQQIIKQAKKQTDVLIVSLHSGIEYQARPSAFQEKFARASVEAGADLVVGHHPHIVGPVERYKQGWIAYSLGNFVFDQAFSQETMQGLLLEIIIEQGAIKQVNPKEIQISDSFQPYPAPFDP